MLSEKIILAVEASSKNSVRVGMANLMFLVEDTPEQDAWFVGVDQLEILQTSPFPHPISTKYKLYSDMVQLAKPRIRTADLTSKRFSHNSARRVAKNVKIDRRLELRGKKNKTIQNEFLTNSNLDNFDSIPKTTISKISVDNRSVSNKNKSSDKHSQGRETAQSGIFDALKEEVIHQFEQRIASSKPRYLNFENILLITPKSNIRQ